jgi:hypothetical protein
MTANPFSNAVFETPLDIRREIEAVKRDGARVEAILLAQYRVSFDWQGKRWLQTVPAGFKAAPSVPPALHGLVPFFGGLFESSIVHDWAYNTRCFDDLTGSSKKGKLAADQLFLALLESAGVNESDRRNIYQAVRFFGNEMYHENTFQPNCGPVLAA